MSFPNPDTQFTSETGREAGQKSSRKDKPNWATVVRELLEDEEFVVKVKGAEGQDIILKYPAKIIADVMIRKAVSGDVGAAKFLRDTGYGRKLEIALSNSEVELENILRELTSDRTLIPAIRDDSGTAAGDDSEES